MGKNYSKDVKLGDKGNIFWDSFFERVRESKIGI